MSKKFDAEAYVARWDAIMVPLMVAVIAVSLILAVILNVKTRPDCLRHEYIFCGTTSQADYANEGHHNPSHEQGAHP